MEETRHEFEFYPTSKHTLKVLHLIPKHAL